MKGKTLKFLSIIMFLLFSISLISGCGSKQASEQKKVTTIEYWHINSESFGAPTVRELIAKFQEQNPDIKVIEKFQPNVYTGLMQNLQAALAAGKPPAVAQIGYNYVAYAAANFPHLSIEDAVKLNAADKDFLTNNYLPNILDLGRINGKVEGLPYSISNPVMYYNADLVKQAGLDPEKPPQTWAELEKAAKVIKEKTGAYGLYVQEAGDNWTQQALMESNGGRILAYKDGKPVAAFNTPESIQAYEQLAKMVLNDKTALHATTEEGFQAFVTGKVGYYIATIARRANIEKSAKFKVSAAVFPTYGDKERRIPAGGNTLFIFAKDPEQQKAAWRFIKFLESPEALAMWTKGTGYIPPRKGVADDPKGLKEFLVQNPLMKAAVEQLPSVVSWVNFPGPNGLQAEQALVDARDSILSGKQTPADALRDAAEKVNKLLAQ